MKEEIADKFHIRQQMFYEFRKYNNATNSTNTINVVYPNSWISEHVSVGLKI